MPNLEQLMKTVAEASDVLRSLDLDREAAMRRRDDAVRAAHAAGATYTAIREVTGMSPNTISKTLNPRRP